MKYELLSRSLLGAGALLGSALILTASAADLNRISSVDEFYTAYGEADGFSPEANAIIDGLFDYVDPFLGPAGLQNAAAAGFVPMTKEWQYHGTHWFNPLQFLSDPSPNPVAPTGLNFDADGNLLAVFWPDQKYGISADILASLGTADPSTLPALYAAAKAATLKPVPTILDMFNGVDWHNHENVIVENVGSRDPVTGFYDDGVKFRQSLTDENFVMEVLTGLADPDITVAPFEFFADPSIYPPANYVADAGFYMVHMWLGLENPDGLFAGTHPDISLDAISEATTFEDGSDGHGHGHGHGGHASVPEAGSVLGLLAIAAAGAASRFGTYRSSTKG